MSISLEYYNILGVSQTATPAEIKKAYRKLVLQYHPDKNPGGEAQFKKIAEAYEVLSDPNRKAEYDKTGSVPSKGSRGGIEAPAMFDFMLRTALYKEIEFAFESKGLYFSQLESELTNLVGHQHCSGHPWTHVFDCLETQSEVEKYKDQVIGLIVNYIEGLSQLKEKTISEVEAYFRENEKYLNDEQKKMIEEPADYGSFGKHSWREWIRGRNTKSSIIDFGNDRKKLIDTLKNSEGDARKHQEEMEKLKRKYSKDNNRKDKNDHHDSGKNSPNLDKIVQLKADIEELRGNVDNPKLTEKEKAVIREKLVRFEKELAELENQSNYENPKKQLPGSNSKDKGNNGNNSNDKDKKIKDLEDEITQLRNNKTETPQQQVETQKKIAEKEKEWKASLDLLTLEQLTSKIQELQTKINQLKTNPNPEISAQEVYLREQLKVLQEAKNRKLSSSPNSPSSKLPTGLIVGVVGGVIILIIGICFVVRKRHGKKSRRH